MIDETDIIIHVPSEAVLIDALNAAREAMDKHHRVTNDPVRAAAILCEEAGEVAKEALLLTGEATRATCSQAGRDRLILMREEARQTAGYALLIMQKIDLGGYEIVFNIVE